MKAATLEQYDIILHIGLPKTGSSALQKFCLDNRNWLSEQGLYYPAHTIDKNGVSGGHAHFYKLVDGGKLNDAACYVDDLLRKSREKNQTLMLSSEALHLHSSKAKSLLADYSVLVIAFFRHPVDNVFSAFNQMVKRHFHCEALDSYVEHSLRNEKPILAGKTLHDWEQVYGERLCVLPYNAATQGRLSVLHTFFDFLNLDTSYVDKKQLKRKINQGYCIAALEFRRLLNYVLTEHDTELSLQLDLELQSLSDSEVYQRIPLQNTLNDTVIRALEEKFSPAVMGIEKKFQTKIPKTYKFEKAQYSSLGVIEELISITKYFKNERKSIFKQLKDKIEKSDWKFANYDQQKLAELFDHNLATQHKEKQAFFTDKVVRDMPGYSEVDFLRESARLLWQRGDIVTAYKLITRALERRKNGPVIIQLHEQITKEYDRYFKRKKSAK